MKTYTNYAAVFCLIFFAQAATARVSVATTADDDIKLEATREKLVRRAGNLPAATDESFNNGTPFKVLIQHIDETGWSNDAVDHFWLMPNGNTTVNCTRAARYSIQEGKLHIAGKIISTDVGDLNMAFEPRLDRGEITTQFFVSNGILNWTSTHFTEGIAQFYKLPPGLLENALILSKFVGPMQPKRGWSPILLNVKPNTICGLLNGDDVEASNSTETELGDFGTRTDNTTTMSSQTTSTRKNRPTSSSSSALSVDGRCGSFNGRTCMESDFGDCCNEYGYCGRFDEYCGTGCQPSYGLCDLNGAAVSSSVTSSWHESASSPETSSIESLTMQQSVSSPTVSNTTGSTISTASEAASQPSDGALSAQRLSPNGRCGANGNYICTGSEYGDCCSYSGYCGNTTNYCSAGCQSDYGLCERGSEKISVDGRCGVRNNMTCTESSFGKCCSSSGYCGDTDDYCGTGCDSGYGSCQNSTSTVTMERNTMMEASMSSITSSFSSLTSSKLYANATLTTSLSTANASSLPSSTATETVSSFDFTTTLTGSLNEPSSKIDKSLASDSENKSVTSTAYTSSDLMTVFPSEIASSNSSNSSSSSSPTQMTDSVTSEISSSILTSYTENETIPGTEPTLATSANSSPGNSTGSTTSLTSSSIIPSASSTPSMNPSSAISSSSTIGSTLYNIASATPVMGDLEAHYADTDDDYGLVILPFEMQLFGQSSNQVFPSTNGLLTLNIGSAEFRNVELPTTNIPALSVAPLWDDFFLTGSSYQGVFYQLGLSNQSVIFEYRLRRAGVPESLYQFQLLYDITSPGVVVFRYFATAETGGTSTIGVQGYPDAAQYSFSKKGAIEPGVEITCDTNTSSCTRGRFSLQGNSIL